jgi:outer membrane protein TolC
MMNHTTAPPRPRRAAIRAATTLAGTFLLAGCASFSPDGGMAPVATFADVTLGKDVAVLRTDADMQAARGAIERLLKRPLTADAAVQIALLNNRGLQAAYNELGLAEAGMVGASLPPNPTIALSRMGGAGEIEIERRIVANILSLATLPARAEIAAQRFRQAQLRAIAETMRVAAEARRTYVRAAAARAKAAYLEQVQSASGSTVQLAKRLGESGAMNKLDQAREHVFHADIAGQLALARRAVDTDREQFVRALGLWGGDLNFRLAALPPLPARVRAQPAVEVDAIRRRVDLQIARIEVDTLAKSYGLTQATRFVNLLEVAGISKTTRGDGDTVNERGVEVEFQIPLFDFGEVRAREAEQRYLMAVNRLVEKAVNVRSEARNAYRSYRAAYDIAAHYQREVLPLRKIISDEMLLRYNAMQIDVFALLTESRQRLAANAAALDARRDFWLADANLLTTVSGAGGAAESAPSSSTIAATGEAAGH